MLFKLFITFFKIGLFSFGGGYGMLPLMLEETLKNGWLTEAEFVNFLAIAESTPGPIAINSATFVGYRTCGFWGSVCATLGVVLPSFGVILAISYILKEFEELKAVQYAFNGIRVGVLALLFKALWSMYQKSPKGWAAYVVMAAAFVLTAFLNVNVLPVIVFCALFGLVTATVAERRMKK